MTKPKLNRPPGMDCPHCGSSAAIRTSKYLTATYREVTYRCDNDACGFAWVAGLEAIRVIVPSIMPNPEVALPFSCRVRPTPPMPANDDMPPAANDDAMTDTG